MRFISKSAHLCAGNYRNAELAISEPKVVMIDGKTRAVQPEPYLVSKALTIQFEQNGIMQADIDAALDHWKVFEGLPLEEDGVTPASPVENGRIGVWDSVAFQNEHGLSDIEREEAERLLLTSTHYGAEFFAVEDVHAAKPWPSYDDTHHSKIAVLASELGLIDESLAYERENKDRPSVISALEEAQPQPATEPAETSTEEVVLA